MTADQKKPVAKKVDTVTEGVKVTSELNFITKSVLHLKNIHAGHRVFIGTELALNIFIFLSVPIRYLVGKLRGEEVSFSRSKWVRWAFAGIGLGILLAEIIVPALGPIFLVASLSVGAITAGYVFFNTLYKRVQLKQEQKNLNEKISNIIHTIQAKQHALQVSTGKHFEELIESTLEGWQRDAFKDSILLRKSLSQTKQQAQSISFKIQKNSNKTMGRSIGFGVTALSLVGVTMALFFPPIGMGIFIASVLLGTGMGMYGFIRQIKAVSNHTLGESHRPAPEQAHHLSSTAELMKDLYQDKAKDVIALLLEQDDHYTNIDRHLQELINDYNPQGVLVFFAELPIFQDRTKEDIAHLFNVRLRNGKQAILLLSTALEAVHSGKTVISDSLREKLIKLESSNVGKYLYENIGVNIKNSLSPHATMNLNPSVPAHVQEHV